MYAAVMEPLVSWHALCQCNKQESRVAWDLECEILFQLGPRSPGNVAVQSQTLVESSGSSGS